MAVVEKTAPRRVNFQMFKEDFQCPLLAAIGLGTAAIAQITGLTEGQVMYRIMKYEDAVRKLKRDGEKEPTSRKKYRLGESDIAQAVINSVSGGQSQVKSILQKRMIQKGIYAPVPKGVMRNKRPSEANRMGV